MPQSNVIFFYLFAAFVVFITTRGELPKYMGFLLASPVNTNTNVNTPGGTDRLGQVTGGATLSNSGISFSDVATVAKTAAMFL